MNVLGLAGWSGSGKTTLIRKLLPELARRGVRASTIKHTHHDVELDRPGKDSYEHRAAGAHEVILVSPRRFALAREWGDGPQPALDELIARLDPVDLVLVEGFRDHPCPKIEVFRPALGKGRLGEVAVNVIAVASDEGGGSGEAGGSGVPRLDLNAPSAIADFIVAWMGRGS